MKDKLVHVTEHGMGIYKGEEGVKFDGDKLMFELIPPEAQVALATILTFGAKKYDDRNWELGMKWSRVYGALQRHLNAWASGEKFDPESGKPHLWHALCCLNFLVTYEIREVGENDLTDRSHGLGPNSGERSEGELQERVQRTDGPGYTAYPVSSKT